MRKVPMNDFRSEPPELLEAQLEGCRRVLHSGWWILGAEVAAFEAEWAAWLNAGAAVGVANGLDAIEIGLRALGIGAGDEVITTPMTAFATVLAILRAGATPVLADIDPGTAMLEPESVRRCISRSTRAIVLVHLYGQIGPIHQLRQLADEGGIHLIEDCAQAHGARLQDRSAGDFGAFGAWSFYPTKNLGAVGDAGALTTRSAALAETARSLRNYGQSVRYHHPLIGMNSRLDELQAALLRVRLKHLDAWVERRRQIARRYALELRNRAVRLLPLPTEAQQHAHHLFVITCAQRAGLQEFLRSRGIDSLIHYPIAIHFQEPCRGLARDPQGLSHAEAHAATCLSLPCHPGMTDADTEAVIFAVNQFGV
jgi:dTDP-4-amino-4,6-dideoxygalactose transaminase